MPAPRPAAPQEYAENRSITSVVPVDNPLTTDEPELLEMSPEQAEETQLCGVPSPVTTTPPVHMINCSTLASGGADGRRGRGGGQPCQAC